MSFYRAFKVFEHVTILVTSLAALVTIAQYWNEQDQRTATHLSATLETYLACQELVRFSMTQESDIIHQYLAFTVDYQEARALCKAVVAELHTLMQQTEQNTSLTAEEVREALRRAIPENAPPDFQFE